MSLLLVVVATLAVVGSIASGQMVPQCQCSAIEPCKQAYVNSILPCMDACQHHATALGANYQTLRQCVVSQEPKLRSTIACVENSQRDACSQGPTTQQVPKRYPETLKIAAMSEINRMLQRSGIADEARSLLATGKRLHGCIQGCMDKRAGNCANKAGCGLLLPSDSQLVQTGKQCAISSGFDTSTVQQLCQCAVQSGVSQLSNICARIQIS